MKTLLVLMFALIGITISFGQVNIPAHNTDYVTNFNGWNGTLPNGYVNSGSGSTFRGNSATLTTGGTYDVANSGYGYQASSTASSLTLVATFRNTTGSAITELEFSYEAFMIYDRTSRIPAWSVTSSLGAVGSLDWTYNISATASSPDLRSITLTGLNIPNNGTFTFTFSSDRGSGSGSTPKIGLNNITVQSVASAPCSILTSGFANLACNNNSTTGTATDDFLNFDLNPTGTSLNANYNVSVSSGSITPTSAAYGSATMFTLNNGSAGGGDVIVTITDAGSGSCTMPVNITDPGACSVPCSVSGTDVQTACNTFNWIDGNTYTSSNNTATFNIVGGAVNGCDSLVTLDLTIINSATGTDVQTACNTFNWIDGNTYTSSNNTATFNIAGGASNGCDSLVTLDLTIINSATGTDVQTACNTFDWIDGNTYTSNNNTATFNIVGGAVNGCDSLVTLDLTIINSATGTDVQTACNTFNWIDGNTYTSNNNTATFNIVGGASNGCDSLVTLDLTIINSATGTDVQTACNTFNWIDGNTYTSSNNTATFNIVGGASNGCDSLVTLDLTIINSATGTDVQTACNTFDWIDGNTYTSNNNTATFNIVGGAVNGCDSLVTLDLTILNSATGTDVQTACGSFDWIDGNTYTSSNNTATFNIVGGASNGCDSLVTLDLTINSVNATVTTQEPVISANAVGATYQWIDCSDSSDIVGETNATFTATANGSYAVIVTENGCSSTSTCVDITTIGLDENSINDVRVYPNPSNGQFSIDFGSLEQPTVRIYTVDNKLVYLQESVEETTLSIDLAKEPGVYFIVISKNQNSFTTRVIVQ